MKLAKGSYINREGEVCVLGALALSQGMSKKTLKSSVDTHDRVYPLLRKKLGLTDKVLDRLLQLNDDGRWKRLEDRLRSLELYHLVRPYALKPITKVKNKTVAKV